MNITIFILFYQAVLLLFSLLPRKKIEKVFKFVAFLSINTIDTQSFIYHIHLSGMILVRKCNNWKSMKNS